MNNNILKELKEEKFYDWCVENLSLNTFNELLSNGYIWKSKTKEHYQIKPRCEHCKSYKKLNKHPTNKIFKGFTNEFSGIGVCIAFSHWTINEIEWDMCESYEDNFDEWIETAKIIKKSFEEEILGDIEK